MKHYLVIVAAIVLFALKSCNTGSRKELIKNPNVLFIAVDDLNDWIEPLGGHPQAVTPNLSRLAGEGVCFNHAYCAGTACNPSRSALMSGLASQNTGMYLNMQVWREVLGDVKTIPQYFTDNELISVIKVLEELS